MGLACRKSELGAAAREAKSVYEGRPGHGHIVIGGGLAAVSGTRAARHPERHAGQEAITAATLSEAFAHVDHMARRARSLLGSGGLARQSPVLAQRSGTSELTSFPNELSASSEN